MDKTSNKDDIIGNDNNHYHTFEHCCIGSILKGKYGRNLHLRVSGANVPSVQESRDWLPVLIHVHCLLLTLL